MVILKEYWAWAELPLKTSVTPPLASPVLLPLSPPLVPSPVVNRSRSPSLVGAKLSNPRKRPRQNLDTDFLRGQYSNEPKPNPHGRPPTRKLKVQTPAIKAEVTLAARDNKSTGRIPRGTSYGKFGIIGRIVRRNMPDHRRTIGRR